MIRSSQLDRKEDRYRHANDVDERHALIKDQRLNRTLRHARQSFEQVVHPDEYGGAKITEHHCGHVQQLLDEGRRLLEQPQTEEH